MAALRSFVIAAGVGAAAVAAAAVYLATRGPSDAPAPAEPAVAATEKIAEPPASATVPDVEIVPPSFDIVRVDPRGTAVIAGRATPGSTIAVTLEGRTLVEAPVDERGEWVAIVEEPLPAGAVELGLVMTTEEGLSIRSEQVVVVAVPETRDSTPLVVLGRPGGPSRLLQTPFGSGDVGPLTLDIIDYDDSGAVIFSGRSEPEASIRVFANDAVLGEIQADEAGRWSLTAGATLPPGVYDLQVDQIDGEGRVTGVIALPFERAEPGTIEVGGDAVVVQPGNSLWRIARRLYGEGIQYTVIYEANREQIRDPDLIYPGQVLAAPGEDG